MKKSNLSLYFILFSIYTSSLLSSAQNESLPVLDTDGNELQAGTDYYILPLRRGSGGGVTLASTGNQTCPLSVVQEQLEVDPGLPLTFRPVNPNEGIVRLQTDQNIQFSAVTVCVQSTVWMVVRDESIGLNVITTGGVEGNPGRETINNWFKIIAFESDYKLLFCPTVCDTCRPICGEVGIFFQDEIRRLALTGDSSPFVVRFRKA